MVLVATLMTISQTDGLRPLLPLLSGAAGFAKPWLPTNLSNSCTVWISAALATLMQGDLFAGANQVLCMVPHCGRFGKQPLYRGLGNLLHGDTPLETID